MAYKPAYSREVRVGAVADYLVGVLTLEVIAAKWSITEPTLIVHWVRKVGCFKTRRDDGKTGRRITT